MSTVFDLLCKSWKESGIEVYELKRGEHYSLFKTVKKYEYKHNFYNTAPTFQCFNNHTGQREFVISLENETLAYLEAMGRFKGLEENY